MVMTKGDVIVPGDLPPLIASRVPSVPERPAASSEAPDSTVTNEKPADLAALSRTLFQWAKEQRSLKILPAVERELVIQSLLETKGNQVQAAKLLGITRGTLRKRIEQFKIKQALAIE
jgi:two-component system nitrogen regulation response regulator GlnG